MAKDQLRDLHLFAMESALPLGIGIINNARALGKVKPFILTLFLNILCKLIRIELNNSPSVIIVYYKYY